MIDKALRSLDIDALFDLRYFIFDLCQLLNDNRLLRQELTVYRGVLIDKEKFETMQSSVNHEDLLSVRGFLSTSRSRDIVQRLLNRENTQIEGAFVLTKKTRSLILNNLGHCWYKKGSFNKAMECFGDTLELQQIESELESLRAFTLNNKAVILMEKGKYETKYKDFQCAVDMIMKQHVRDDISHILSNMGTIKKILDDYEGALRLYQQTDDALRRVGVHDKHQRIATNKMNTAFVYLNQARWTEVKKVLYQAKKYMNIYCLEHTTTKVEYCFV